MSVCVCLVQFCLYVCTCICMFCSINAILTHMGIALIVSWKCVCVCVWLFVCVCLCVVCVCKIGLCLCTLIHKSICLIVLYVRPYLCVLIINFINTCSFSGSSLSRGSTAKNKKNETWSHFISLIMFVFLPLSDIFIWNSNEKYSEYISDSFLSKLYDTTSNGVKVTCPYISVDIHFFHPSSQ